MHPLRLQYISTGGILYEARQSGLVRKLKPILDRMQNKGLGIWNYDVILAAAGE